MAATAVWSEGNPLSAGWENHGWTDGSWTNGRGSVCTAPASFTRTATARRPTTISTAIATFSGRATVSQTSTASAATTYSPAWATNATTECTHPGSRAPPAYNLTGRLVEEITRPRWLRRSLSDRLETKGRRHRPSHRQGSRLVRHGFAGSAVGRARPALAHAATSFLGRGCSVRT